jgi:hypothetical protein
MMTCASELIRFTENRLGLPTFPEQLEAFLELIDSGYLACGQRSEQKCIATPYMGWVGPQHNGQEHLDQSNSEISLNDSKN